MKYDIHKMPVKIKMHASQRIAERINGTMDIEEKVYFVRRLIKEGKVIKDIRKDGEVGIIKKGKYRAKFTVREGILWVLTIEEG
ncbi:MAG: DUF4258 domain-containing protein [Euryarchaeota archaeon]|nr:DUF4258 domain-containing protein [Euryarchaeota archaeon]